LAVGIVKGRILDELVIDEAAHEGALLESTLLEDTLLVSTVLESTVLESTVTGNCGCMIILKAVIFPNTQRPAESQRGERRFRAGHGGT
jgi:hypothetical protein